GPTLSSSIDPRFGRCQYFLIIDEKGKLVKSVANESDQAMRGAGVTAAQIVANEKVEVVITGNVGPNAHGVLSGSGIKIFPGAFGMTVKQALKAYKEKKLKEVEPSTGYGFGPGFGKGMGSSQGVGPGRRGR
ncbi:NifB/NifX family molybdenum-iron cluster-binding protein, partial [Candidatus Parcubacteria bacterium]|nr:NifB/NifX family molybdenum-iron cluster-binding protein [Candidatus Parcubacteria bacterium]